MTGRPFVLREVSWKALQAEHYDIAVLPWGATEAHNLHLPYGTDSYESEAVALAAAGLAWEAGARVIVLPGIPFGVNTGQLDIPLTINLNPSTQLIVLRDIVESLQRGGIEKLVIVNGHGGNEPRALIRELQGTHPMLIAAVNWWQIEPGARYFDEPGDHAGELETSMMMHIAPEVMLPLEEAGSGAVRSPRITAFREGWAWTPRVWTQVTTDTGVGNPAAATREKGERFFNAITGKLSGFLVELASTPRDQLYGHREES